MAANMVIGGRMQTKYAWIKNLSMLLTHCFAHLAGLHKF
jgi:hypothetical protein